MENTTPKAAVKTYDHPPMTTMEAFERFNDAVNDLKAALAECFTELLERFDKEEADGDAR